MKMYISGKITGDPDYKKKFKSAHVYLTAQEHVTMNPANMTIGFTHDEYMTVCLAMVSVCDGVYMLKDWRDSDGAKEEHEFAIEHGKKIFYE